MADPGPKENSSQNFMTQIPKLILPSGGIVGMLTLGPWQTIAVGITLLIIRGMTWSLKNPEDFWDKVESHRHRGKKALSRKSRSKRSNTPKKKTSQK